MMKSVSRMTLLSMIFLVPLAAGCTASPMYPTFGGVPPFARIQPTGDLTIRSYGEALWNRWETLKGVTLTELKKQQKANLDEILPELESRLEPKQRAHAQRISELVAERRDETDLLKQRQATLADRIDRAEKDTRKLAGVDIPVGVFVRAETDRIRGELRPELNELRDRLVDMVAGLSEAKLTSDAIGTAIEKYNQQTADLAHRVVQIGNRAEIQERAVASQARDFQFTLDATEQGLATKLFATGATGSVGGVLLALLAWLRSSVTRQLSKVDQAAVAAAEAKAAVQMIRAQFPETIRANVTLESVKAPARRRSKTKPAEPTE